MVCQAPRVHNSWSEAIGHENKDTPASGRSSLSTLDEIVANFAVSNGKIALQDYFQPYEYIAMDAGDRDLGSGGVALLDPSVFKGTNAVTRVAVTIGKNGKAYIMYACPIQRLISAVWLLVVQVRQLDLIRPLSSATSARLP